ncbi:hypothetical protein NDU88_000643 [Pleurodeles waltl]|uniref:Uncharacterized protein n=1 Tax=Pleurodeles waltl TaxID=8319 RepID=A0AAV7MHF1_PLEWA|nr:hypothetical protein NDU88_000643 [Pleurodeles waltl]
MIGHPHRTKHWDEIKCGVVVRTGEPPGPYRAPGLSAGDARGCAVARTGEPPGPYRAPGLNSGDARGCAVARTVHRGSARETHGPGAVRASSLRVHCGWRSR